VSKNSTVKILSVDNPSQRFGNTDYAIFQAETTNGKTLAVGISHNALSRKGIDANNVNMLDLLSGSPVTILSAPVDIREPKGKQLSGEERVATIIDGIEINGKVRTLLLCSAADCSLQKSELVVNKIDEINVSVSAKVMVERDKEKRLQAAYNAVQRRKQLALETSSATAPTVPTAPVVEEPAF
jgi:hypothetical protein